MRADKDIVDLIKSLDERYRGSANGADGIFFSKVTSVDPLIFEVNGIAVSKENADIYINPALLKDPKEAFNTPFEPVSTSEFLKDFHEKYALNNGETVIVIFSGNSFFIAGKAVKV